MRIGKALLTVLAISACSTPYQPKGAMGGYEDYPAGAGVRRITFSGNGYTSSGEVLRMWHRRAAEICGGEEAYEVISTDRDSSTVAVGGSVTTIQTSGNTAYATTTGPTYVTRHEVTGLIRCQTGAAR